ncbi:Myblike DNAbinding domain-containing protein [Ordospora colligata]|uniref:Myb-like transcription factor n=1 Tax=Ordospora colligata OC4 TaxID=1354746 RepID=A0A0B2UJM0_9MICR|nr:Myb-like transcription factor [Ordospora colligata OC4]KHN69439.1 Myb-like transcription factor [Ordospora colligata OC4]TBU15254.1 Myb-like transcription factor [Ordospora colligata]
MQYRIENSNDLDRKLEQLYMDYVEIEKIVSRLKDIKKRCTYRSEFAKIVAKRKTGISVEMDSRDEERFCKTTKGCMRFDLNDDFWNEMSKMFNAPRNECFNRWINRVEDYSKNLSKKDAGIINSLIQERNDWLEISAKMHCRPFDAVRLYLGINTDSMPKMWTSEEDGLLEKGVEKHGLSKWRYVSKVVGTKTGKECAMRYYFLNKSVKKGKWSDDEKLRLVHAVDICREGDWRCVSNHVMTRNPIQCRSKYIKLNKDAQSHTQ